VNATDAALSVAYDFGRWTIDPAVESYCTSERFDLAPDAVTPACAAHAFTASLPPGSVTTFRGGLAKPGLHP
jgi:hypothetical protein